MIKIIDLCPICGGRGRFFTQKCKSCRGQGGKILKYDSRLALLFEPNRGKLSEQEINIFALYKNGSSPKEITRSLDLSMTQLCVALHNIERKLNSPN